MWQHFRFLPFMQWVSLIDMDLHSILSGSDCLLLAYHLQLIHARGLDLGSDYIHQAWLTTMKGLPPRA